MNAEKVSPLPYFQNNHKIICFTERNLFYSDSFLNKKKINKTNSSQMKKPFSVNLYTN